jgi:hypothetical protein
MREPRQAIQRACGLFGKVRDDALPNDRKLAGQVATWALLRKHFVRPNLRPSLVLLDVDPWPNRPLMQPWLDQHFHGLYRRVKNRVELDARALDSGVAMDLFTNVMRFLPISASGGAADQVPQIYNLILRLEEVEAGVIDGFLAEFETGHTWGRPMGSLPSAFRAGVKRFVEGAKGRWVVHPTMGMENLVSVYASEETLAPELDGLGQRLTAWHRAAQAGPPA